MKRSPSRGKGANYAQSLSQRGVSWEQFPGLPLIAIAVTAGAALLLHLPNLPSAWWWAAIVGLFALAWRWPLARLPLFVALGFGLAWVSADARLSAWLPTELEGQSLIVEGRVSSLPGGASRRFDFDIERLVSAGEVEVHRAWSGGLVRLGWMNGPPLHLGERWRLVVRLKAPRGFSNPGLFDYERWLFQRGHTASGYVREREQAPRLLAPPEGLAAWRQGVIDHVAQALEGRPLRGVIVALAAGERAFMTDDEWRVFRSTGSGHLVAISGLHVGLVAGLVFLLARRVAGRWNLWLPAPRLAAIAALSAAAVYAALAGFALPTQRALVMLGAAFLAPMLGRGMAPLQSLSLALLAVVLIDPLAVLAPGFWLSFSAVGVILFLVIGRGGAPRWWRWGRVHGLVSVGLAPLSLLWFTQASVVAPLANLLAVPWVSLLVVPLTLLGVVSAGVFEPLSVWALREAAAMLAGIWPALSWLGGLDWASWQPGLGGLALVAMGMAFLLIAAPRGWPGRWLALPLLLPVLWPKPLPAPPPGGFEFTVFDVGQGLASFIRTANHTLLYDTGPRYRGGFDAGERIVLPYLRSRGVETLDTLIVSHGDNDHRGGLEGVLSGVRARRLLSGEPPRVPGASPCRDGESWTWDGVRFDILGPAVIGAVVGNDASCVLRVATSGDSLLLTADLEAKGETHLLSTHSHALPVGVLQVPHHGSASSSRPAFVAAARPRIAIVTAGYRNAFGLPRAEVMARYRSIAATIRDTRMDGALTLSFPAEGPARVVNAQRRDAHRIWTAN